MATNIWQGITDNWGTTSNWSLGAIPVDTNNVVFPATNSQSIYNSVDQTGVDLATVTLSSGCKIGIATSGQPLILSASRFEHFGLGGVYISPDVIIDLLIVDSPNKNEALVLGGAGSTRIHVKSGDVVITAAVTNTITSLECSYKNNKLSDSRITSLSTSATITNLRMNGGYVETNSNVTSASIQNGTWTATAGAVTTLENSGGTVYYNSSTINANAYFWLYSGLTDLTNNPNALTIHYLRQFQGAIYRGNSALHTITDGGNGSSGGGIPIYS